MKACCRAGRLTALLAAACLISNAGAVSAEITLTLVTSPAFGLFFSGSSGRQWALETDGSITGTNAGDYISGALAGHFTVADDVSPSSIVILVDNITTAGGLSVSDATCSYDGGAQQSCDGSGMNATSVASAPLKVGLDVSTTQAHAGADTASVTMDVSVNYL